MKIKGQQLADHVYILMQKFGFKTVEELHKWLLERPNDTFEIKY